jgi:AcrR family transcriptional regulator
MARCAVHRPEHHRPLTILTLYKYADTVSKSLRASSWREARRRDARADLVATAWEIVREDGLGGLSLRDLARRAGITTPTVYAYFESKNAIFDAMFEEAAQSFADSKLRSAEADGPQSNLVADARRFVDFCTSDVARYQLLFQHLLPGFVPSPQAYAPAVRALEMTREMLARNGVGDPAHWDIWTALMTGLVDQQIANDPGGDRWSRLVDEVVTMFLAHCARTKPTATPNQSGRRSETKKRSSHA